MSILPEHVKNKKESAGGVGWGGVFALVQNKLRMPYATSSSTIPSSPFIILSTVSHCKLCVATDTYCILLLHPCIVHNPATFLRTMMVFINLIYTCIQPLEFMLFGFLLSSSPPLPLQVRVNQCPIFSFYIHKIFPWTSSASLFLRSCTISAWSFSVARRNGV